MQIIKTKKNYFQTTLTKRKIKYKLYKLKNYFQTIKTKKIKILKLYKSNK